jgi:hypothetical protein
MDVVSIWSTKIAEEITPDEVDLAPLMAQAFVSGGRDRTELFHQARGGALGGFGPGELAAIFPWILHSLATAGPVLSQVLAAIEAGEKFPSAVKGLLSLPDMVARRKQIASLPDDPYASLKHSAAVISHELKPTKISDEQRELISYRILMALLTDPRSAAEFVRGIASANGS